VVGVMVVVTLCSCRPSPPPARPSLLHGQQLLLPLLPSCALVSALLPFSSSSPLPWVAPLLPLLLLLLPAYGLDQSVQARHCCCYYCCSRSHLHSASHPPPVLLGLLLLLLFLLLLLPLLHLGF